MEVRYFLFIALTIKLTAHELIYIVPEGDIENITITTQQNGEHLFVEKGSSISTNGIGLYGVTNTFDNVAITNKGSITTQGLNSFGIHNYRANDFVITNSGSITTQAALSPGIFTFFGDDFEITNSGFVSTEGDNSNGIYNSSGNTGSIINRGSTSTLGNNANGIYTLNSDDIEITNSGTILTQGDNANGIYILNSDNIQIINSGITSTQGNNAYGIYTLNLDNVQITNSGATFTLGNNAHGIYSLNLDNVQITNSGSLSTEGDNAYGIYSLNSENIQITNNDTTSTQGNNAYGIYIFNSDNVEIINNGTISTEGDNAYGIYTNQGTNIHIINSGIIRSINSFALNLDGLSPTLTLLQGSILEGPVQALSALDLNVEPGLNLNLTLSDASSGFGSLGIGAPFVLSDLTIAVIDPTGFALQPDVIADLSDTVLDNIYRQRLGCCNPCSCGLWAQAIGSYRNRKPGNQFARYDNWQGGVLLGLDMPFCHGNTSLFGGATLGRAEVSANTQRSDINSYLGGVTYSTCFWDTFFGLAFVAGYLDWDNKRYVMNNLASDGVETAHADINGLFISPEVTLTRQFTFLLGQPILSCTVRYAGFFQESYHEEGSTANLFINDREIDLLTTRFEVAFAYGRNPNRSCCWRFVPYAGGFGRFQLGGYQIEGQLLDQTCYFTQKGPRDLAAVLLGFRGILSFGCLNCFLNIEGSVDNESSYRILGEGGIGWNF